MATEGETHQSADSSQQLKLLDKLLAYSIVSKTVGKSRELYARGKASSPYVTRTLDVVEHSVSEAVKIATPYVSKYDTQIRQLDSVACEKLEVIEKQVPELASKITVAEARQLSKRVLEESRNGAYKVYDAKLKPKVDDARNLVDAKYANLLGTLDTYVDYWLPEPAKKTKTDDSGVEDEKTNETTDRSARSLTNKVTGRVGRIAVQQFGLVRSRSLESLDRARDAGMYLLSTASNTYEELSRAVHVEIEEEKRQATTEKTEQQESTTDASSPSYGDLQRRLRDSVLLGRAFTKVGTRYAVAFTHDVSRRAYDSSLSTYAGRVIKILPVYIPQIRIGVRVADQKTTETQVNSQTASESNDKPTESNNTDSSTTNGQTHSENEN